MCVVRILWDFWIFVGWIWGGGWDFWAAGVGEELEMGWEVGLVVGGVVFFELAGADGEHVEDGFPVFAAEAAGDALENCGR